MLDLGIQWIVAFQGMGEWLLAPMKFFSFLGDEQFFLLLLPLLYWSIDAGTGLRVGIILLLSNGLNGAFKLALHDPRPYWYSTEVAALSAETSFGIPSGHSQVAVSVWGVLADAIKRRWAWAAAVFIFVMIGLSRLYLGVHFPTDVLLGWTIGGLVLWLFLKFWAPIVERVKNWTVGQQILSAFAGSLLIIVIGVIPFMMLANWTIPEEWIANTIAAGIEEMPDPVSMDAILTSAGTFFGFLAGLAWLRSRGGFDSHGALWQRAARYIVGLVGVILLWYGLGEIFPRGETILPQASRYVRYALLGLWVSAGAPWLFIRLKLSKPRAT